MNNNSEPIQLGLLPDSDVPMRLLQQKPVKAHKDKRKQDFSKEAQARVLDAHNGQIHPDKTIAQPTSEWEQSQEFEVAAGGQNVRR